MPLAQYLRDTFNNWLEATGASEDQDIPEVQNTALDPTASFSSAHLPITDLPMTGCSEGAARASMDNNIGEFATSEVPDLDLNSNTDLKARNDEYQPEQSTLLVEEDIPKFSAEASPTKDLEIATLRTWIKDRDFAISRLGAEAERAREVKRVLIREKNDLAHANVGFQRRADRLEAENGRLASERQMVEARAVRAEGCAQGLKDELRATNTRVQHWEKLYHQAVEEARDRVLGAYALPSAQGPIEDQHITSATTTTTEEQRLSLLVENLRKENGELQEKLGHQKTILETWDQEWEDYNKELQDWEQAFVRLCEQEKQTAVETERNNCRLASANDVQGQSIRRQCEDEKQQALAAERENCRIQLESQESSLRGHFAMKPKADTDREVQRLRRRSVTQRKKQMKVKKSGIKSVVNKAVSHAVTVECSLLQGQFQAQFQIDFSNYKTQFEYEHAIAQAQSGAHNNANPKDQVLLKEEIKKRDDEINSHKNNLTETLEANRKLEASLKLKNADIERLSKAVMAYESQNSLANKTNTEVQISLMARDLSRALKLLAEVSILGLDEKHRCLLNELVLANKVVANIRSTIEDESAVVDYDAFQGGLDRVMESSDPFDALDSRERPALHAQLSETYAIVGALSKILACERGDKTKGDILKRIYKDNAKGKGKALF